jgi:hypothetical protein
MSIYVVYIKIEQNYLFISSEYENKCRLLQMNSVFYKNTLMIMTKIQLSPNQPRCREDTVTTNIALRFLQHIV